jgi:hypothetical protein
MEMVAIALWRGLHTPGHDACRLERAGDGWRLEGAAVFRDETGPPARLAYEVECDQGWRTRRGRVRGWLGSRPIDLVIARGAAGWTLNGAVVHGLEDCVDLDFGFTPATNVLPLRRLALAEGQAAEAPAAWLDAAAGTLTRLPQRYVRRSAATYWYESPTSGYTGLLEMAASGFVQRYPGLWEMEPPA